MVAKQGGEWRGIPLILKPTLPALAEDEAQSHSAPTVASSRRSSFGTGEVIIVLGETHSFLSSDRKYCH